MRQPSNPASGFSPRPARWALVGLGACVLLGATALASCGDNGRVGGAFSFAPASGSVLGGTEVTLTGHAFSAAMTVTFGGVPAAAVTVVSASEVKVLTPEHSKGAVVVSLIDGAGATRSSTVPFVFEGVLQVAAVQPSSGSVAGGTQVIIVGAGFTDGAQVRFGAAPAATVAVVNDGVLQALTPAGEPGPVDVEVAVPGQAAVVVPHGFTFVVSHQDAATPRVVSAGALDNVTVSVAFNEPMNDDALKPENYLVSTLSGANEPTRLIVNAAAFADGGAGGPDRTRVTLTTTSQSAVTYTLRATGMRDLDGNVFGAPVVSVGGAVVDPAVASFTGIPTTGVAPDSDGDGLSDAAEQLGWVVTVTLADGSSTTHLVTSDPFTVDTDGDGMSDREEKQYGINPRSSDTDGDVLSDYQELNEIYSNPTKQDTDDDALPDGLEFNFFGTSALLKDSDGDQMSDAAELLELNRNPRLADLPRVNVKVGDVRLQLDRRFSYTDEDGEERSETQSTASVLGQSQSQTAGRESSSSTQTEIGMGQSLKASADFFPPGGSMESTSEFSTKMAMGSSFTASEQSAQETHSSYEQAAANARAFRTTRTVHTETLGARMELNITLENQGDTAFSISNLEITALQPSSLGPEHFLPVASLVASSQLEGGPAPTFNLGPLVPVRGPVVFGNQDIFPSLVEALMRAPRGLLFEVANYDITDELGRNFAFTSQEINDRTAEITLDFADGRVEPYRVATASTFDAAGKPRGLPIGEALSIILPYGVVENETTAIDRDTQDPTILQSYGTVVNDQGIEVLSRIRNVQTDLTRPQDPSVPDPRRFWAVIVNSSRGFNHGTNFRDIVVRAGESYLIRFVKDEDGDRVFSCEEALYGSSDYKTDTDGDGLDDYTEIRTGWLVPGSPNDRQVYPDPRAKDSDNDGLLDRLERELTTDPRRKDTDEDGINDYAERFGVVDPAAVVPVDVVGSTVPGAAAPDGVYGYYTVRIKDPASNDPDVTIERTLFPYVDPAPVAGSDPPRGRLAVRSTDDNLETVPAGDDVLVVDALGAPTKTADDLYILPGPNGLLDTQEGDLVGDDTFFEVPLTPELAEHLQVFATNPLRADSDGDTVLDGREILVGGNPNDGADQDKIIDTDGDGLMDSEERAGWDVVIDHGLETRHVYSDPTEPDSDHDGIPDVWERAIGTDPQRADTDGDLLTDLEEFDPENLGGLYTQAALDQARQRCEEGFGCYFVPGEEALGTDPRLTDTDGDSLTDRFETRVGWDVVVIGSNASFTRVYSDPLRADQDGDLLLDGAERLAGTNPSSYDTDGDGVSDKIELDQNAEITGGLPKRNPLEIDQLVEVTYEWFNVYADCDNGGGGEFTVHGGIVLGGVPWMLYLGPGGSIPWPAGVNNYPLAYPPLKFAFPYQRPGQYFRLSSQVSEYDGVWYGGVWYEYDFLYLAQTQDYTGRQSGKTYSFVATWAGSNNDPVPFPQRRPDFQGWCSFEIKTRITTR